MSTKDTLEKYTGMLAPSQFDATLHRLADAAHRPANDSLGWELQALHSDITRQLVASDLAEASWLLARLDQLTQALRSRLSKDHERLWTALSDLTSTVRTYLRHLEQEASESRREHQATTLHERICATLAEAGPRRPIHLVQKLGVSAPQVSRALRQLEHKGQIEQTGETRPDARAVWYQLADHPNTHAATAHLREVAEAFTAATKHLTASHDIAAILLVDDTQISIGNPAAVQRIIASGQPRQHRH